MTHSMKRRTFLKASAAAPVFLAAAARAGAPAMAATDGYKKALIIGKPTEKNLEALKAAGFDGAETQAADVTPAEAEASRKAAEATGTRIHSVLRGWMSFNGKPDEVAGSIAKVETALAAAQGYGADAILLVPCRIGGKMKMPEPWEFDIRFDESNGHLKQVAAGDNAPFADYIQAHDHAADTSREAIKRLIPAAEKTGVVIAVENVWNNLWVKPDLFAHFVRSFDSKWVQAYFDIGNHVKYAPAQEFIKALGSLLAKCHVKDFQLNADGHGGKFVDIRDGSVDWPAVMKCLDAAGYHGWMTIEGSGGLSDDEKSKRLDLIIAGK